MRQRVIGLTGGIATGKTTVANYLANQYQLPILDADHYAREAVQPGSQRLLQIYHRYGPDILQADATLNRRYLAQIIFQDEGERHWIEALIHPYVRDRLQAEQQALSSVPILVMVIPLLFEVKMQDLVSETWVVVCSYHQQCQRLMQRDQLTLAEAEARINAQMPLSLKQAQATVVLENGGDWLTLHQQLDHALQPLG